MANSEIAVHLSSSSTVMLDSDNPDLGKLVDKIVELRDSLDIGTITVECASDEFDADSFTEVIRDSAHDFLEQIQLEKDKFDQVMKTLSVTS